MQQQINLYRYLKTPPKFFLTFERILILYGLFTVLLLINFLFELSSKNELLAAANKLSIELKSETQQLEQIKLQYPSVNLTDLQGTMKRLKEELGTKGELATILHRQTRFSNYLSALGTAIIPGVWLTEIEISKSGKELSLKGMTIKSTLLQDFVEQLRKQPLFLHTEFKLQEITQTPENQAVAPYVNFIITGTADNQ